MSDPTINPQQTALLVMDYQNGILSRLDSADRLLTRATEAIATVREHGGHVGYVRVAFSDDDLKAIPAHASMARAITPERRAMMHVDQPASQIHDQVAPQDGDMVVRKVRVGAFSTTDLARQLQERGVTTLILAGVSTSGVVLSTLRDAADRDYRLFVLADACADPDPEVHAFLIDRILPRQAEVISVADLDRLLGSAQ